MANIINGTDTGSGGLITTGDSSDELQIQTAETTAITITSGQQSAFIAGTASAPAVTTTGDLNTGIYFPAADNIGFATGGTIRGRWTDDGLCFGSDTAAANALDDYEEGTFTPTLTGSTSNPSVTYDTGNTKGSYTKIGNQVTVVVEIRTTAYSGGSGTLRLSGLPFTSNSANFFHSAIFLYNITFDASDIYLMEIPTSSTHGTIVECVSNSTSNVVTTSFWSNSNPAIIRFTATYLV